MAALAEILGDYSEAALLHREGIRLAEELHLWTDVSYRLSGLGRIALLTGDFDESRELHERAMRVAAEQSHRFAEQFAEVGLALVARRTGDLDAARAHLQHWLEWDRRLESAQGIPFYDVVRIEALIRDAVSAAVFAEEFDRGAARDLADVLADPVLSPGPATVR